MLPDTVRVKKMKQYRYAFWAKLKRPDMEELQAVTRGLHLRQLAAGLPAIIGNVAIGDLIERAPIEDPRRLGSETTKQRYFPGPNS